MVGEPGTEAWSINAAAHQITPHHTHTHPPPQTLPVWGLPSGLLHRQSTFICSKPLPLVVQTYIKRKKLIFFFFLLDVPGIFLDFC